MLQLLLMALLLLLLLLLPVPKSRLASAQQLAPQASMPVYQLLKAVLQHWDAQVELRQVPVCQRLHLQEEAVRH
jgi:hypothetical protein